jgi:hypothetical protein
MILDLQCSTTILLLGLTIITNLTRQKGSRWKTIDINNYSLPTTMPIMPVVYSCPKPMEPEGSLYHEQYT